MSELPAVTGREAIRAFASVGFVEHRIKGSHHILKKSGYRFLLTVPVHGKRPLKRGTLRRLIGDAGLTVEQFVDLRSNVLFGSRSNSFSADALILTL